MGIETESVMAKSFGGGGGGWGGVMAKPCDSCKTASASIYCKHDSAFLCLHCDTKIHKPTATSRHQRVWMCQVCEQAPAVVTCKADAAALCVTCDADIHSANPLARRHERVPVEPFFDSAESMIKSSSVFNFISHHEEEVASWLLPNPTHLIGSKLVDDEEIKPGHDLNTNLFFTDMDSFLDFDYPNPVHHNTVNDSVVPVQTKPIATENCYDIDFCKSKLNSFDYQYQPQSLSHSVSSSSLDVGVVPEGNSMSEISYPFNQTVPDPSLPVCASASQATGIDREARVLRYREKRKNRKFEKTIRYASRKAYAETRPRIKGRFAKRTEILNDVDDIYGTANSPAFLVDAYGVVPTF